MIVEKNIIDNFNKFSEILNTSLHPMVRGFNSHNSIRRKPHTVTEL